ncbi:MAG: MogA/MoaB family molybdenum cofactor biosynthesis protein [Acidobacteria bacterium]|nr:MogA/MoaB family molybdenum cofactor biosynthesis protein [Acidobacteriota bacterium]MBU4307143.1 MogA/MoaB family molybdenum cofactor biosynthesis protein [Acidobacteriota bacterium]MBU4405471.1 MogA/MoaB family molybdenum cofactor biosynthesis protein [Acidobacteriota bacterium]MCG2812665.1 MogA/MoaB family molybdenum cofactor biosynthesis protein [Candidatus Aminicenantes bacterium]
MLKVAVITVSDRAARGEYADLSGPRIREILEQRLPGADISLTVVPDEVEAISQAIAGNLDRDYILTSGGTGLSPRDITPEICARICDRAIPGISEWLRRESARETPHAVFSRAYSGMKGHTVIVNFPGSLRGAEFCATLMAGIMPHGRDMIRGGGHETSCS